MSQVLPAPALIFLDSQLALLPAKLRTKPLESLRLTTKTSRLLSTEGVVSVGDLIDTAAKGLPAQRGLGASSIDEICLALEKVARRSGGENKDFEARYSASGRAVFFFRASRLKEMSYQQLNKPIEILGFGKDALLFARKTCMAASLGRFLEKCGEGVRIGRPEYARPIPEICRALQALTKSVAPGGRANWRGYRRLSGLHDVPEELVSIEAVPAKRRPLPAVPVRTPVVPRYMGHWQRVQFEFSELVSISDEAKRIRLDHLLSRRAFNACTRLGVATFGALVELVARGFSQPNGFGKKCYIEIAALLEAAASITDSYGHIDLPVLCGKIGRSYREPIAAAPDRLCTPYVTTEFPILRYTSENLERLSDQARSQPLHNLHLDSRAATTMEKHGVRDVGTFVGKLKEGINANRLRNFGRRAFNELAESIAALSSSIDAKGECDWTAYASARGFEVLPFGEIRAPREALESLSEIVVQAVAAQFKGQKDFRRQMDVFNGRLHSPIDDYLTLEQLGMRHGLSRERIRQNEMHIARCISAPLLLGCYSIPVVRSKGKSYEALRFRFRPAVETALQSANAALDAAGRKVWRLDNWAQFLSQVWSADPHFVERNVLLLSVLFRFSLEAQTVDGENKEFLLVSEEVPTAVKQEFRDLLKDIHLSMQGSAEGLSTAEILAPLGAEQVLKGLALEAEELMALSPAVFQIQPGVWKIKPDFFKPKVGKLTCDAVYEILSDNGSRMHNSQLLRRFKLRHPDFLESDRLLTARMFLDPRFRPIGRSGYWVLAEWNQETGTIREVIAKVLEEAEGPMHINDILRSVRMRVPCKETSIRAYLADSPEKYIKLSSATYGLASRYPNRLRHADN